MLVLVAWLLSYSVHLVLQSNRWCFIRCRERLEAPSSPRSLRSVSGVCHTGIPEISVGAERLQQEQLRSLDLYGGISGCDGAVWVRAKVSRDLLWMPQTLVAHSWCWRTSQGVYGRFAQGSWHTDAWNSLGVYVRCWYLEIKSKDCCYFS